MNAEPTIRPITKVLVANRGEIAVRVLRACRELGLQSVAVYSEADQAALHVRSADQAVLIGPAAPRASYLNIERILEAARMTGAQAIHPGYGFLSENAAFAEAVSAAGLIFIGPPAAAIRAMGDKAVARQRVAAAGVPIIPGYQGGQDDAALAEAAAGIGFPLMVKAAAGGGGKGMRIVADSAGLAEALAAARREAAGAFGDDRLILEKFIPAARHIEFQVIGDQHGNLIHLGERECSVQRRHQKIIEETPSPLLDAGLRAAMGAAAVAAARSAGYTNAGTVEFIVDPLSRQYYFLEMNTRLQVEHPITEQVIGLDLVQWQIRLAAGERLPYRQEQITQRGHAIECRLYAEDPANQFLPASGRLLEFSIPAGPGLRLDGGFARGDEISVYYDPLIAKLIASAENRPAAIRKLRTALKEAVILGLTTNIRFLQDVLEHAEFTAGLAHTTWVEQIFSGWSPQACPPPSEVILSAALVEMLGSRAVVSPDGSEAPPTAHDPYSPWRTPGRFRAGEGR